MAPRAVRLDEVAALYRRHALDLGRARAAQRALHELRGDVRLERWAAYRAWTRLAQRLGLPAGRMRRFAPRFDDIEAEILYLLVRDRAPERVVEIGAGRGWSTTWILRALADAGSGQLTSFDLRPHASWAVPPALAAGRWRFVHGDVRSETASLPGRIDLLLVDAEHSAEFARWTLEAVLPRVAPDAVVCVDDVFHTREPDSHGGEGAVIVGWLEARGIPYLTAAPARAPEVFDELESIRRSFGLADPIHGSNANPAIFFCAPGGTGPSGAQGAA